MTNEYSGPERRSSKRVNVDFIVHYSLHRPVEITMGIGSQKIDALMLDLSEEGMSIATNYYLSINTPLFINFTLISDNKVGEDRIRKMVIEGEVISRFAINADEYRSDEYRLGIQFREIREEDKVAIREFVGSFK